MKDASSLINSYYEWLKSKTVLREVNGWLEITTPYIDRHNDYIQIYLSQQGGEYVLTDDGYTISDLIQSGCSLDTPRRKSLLKSTLNGFGVRLVNDALEVSATEQTFSLQKHNLLQAILAISDLFYVARTNVESFFFEDVALWMDETGIRYTPNVNFVGHSRFNHQFDFVIPKSRQHSERILKVINNPNKDTAQNVAFAWLDTKNVRPADSVAFAILNDHDHSVSNPVVEALKNYSITPVLWSQRDDYREKLAA